MQPGHAEQPTHDYVRHGTTTLFAALEIVTGQVTGLCKNRHRHQEFLAFLRHLARAYPDRELHLVVDNYGTHKRPEVNAWLAANPRIHLHFTPTSGSWLNLEVWFGIIERQAIRRGTFRSVRELTGKIRQFIAAWNDRKHPFIWTKTPDEILTKINRKRIFNAGPLASSAPKGSASARSLRTSLGRLLSSFSTARRCCVEWVLKSVPLGK
jgi:transposase